MFRNFPLDETHPHAVHATEALEATAAQDRFWQMHDTLFEHQRALDDRHLVKCATVVGLDVARFEHDLTCHAFAERVRADIASGPQRRPRHADGLRQRTALRREWDVDTLLAARQKY